MILLLAEAIAEDRDRGGVHERTGTRHCSPARSSGVHTGLLATSFVVFSTRLAGRTANSLAALLFPLPSNMNLDATKPNLRQSPIKAACLLAENSEAHHTKVTPGDEYVVLTAMNTAGEELQTRHTICIT